VIAVIFGFLVLHEQFGFYTLVAMGVTIGGVYLVNQGFKPKTNTIQSSLVKSLKAVPALLRFW
jgi:drug/metabolite transporter (DMT)-like permease